MGGVVSGVGAVRLGAVLVVLGVVVRVLLCVVSRALLVNVRFVRVLCSLMLVVHVLCLVLGFFLQVQVSLGIRLVLPCVMLVNSTFFTAGIVRLFSKRASFFFVLAVFRLVFFVLKVLLVVPGYLGMLGSFGRCCCSFGLSLVLGMLCLVMLLGNACFDVVPIALSCVMVYFLLVLFHLCFVVRCFVRITFF